METKISTAAPHCCLGTANTEPSLTNCSQHVPGSSNSSMQGAADKPLIAAVPLLPLVQPERSRKSTRCSCTAEEHRGTQSSSAHRSSQPWQKARRAKLYLTQAYPQEIPPVIPRRAFIILIPQLPTCYWQHTAHTPFQEEHCDTAGPPASAGHLCLRAEPRSINPSHLMLSSSLVSLAASGPPSSTHPKCVPVCCRGVWEADSTLS